MILRRLGRFGWVTGVTLATAALWVVGTAAAADRHGGAHSNSPVPAIGPNPAVHHMAVPPPLGQPPTGFPSPVQTAPAPLAPVNFSPRHAAPALSQPSNAMPAFPSSMQFSNPGQPNFGRANPHHAHATPGANIQLGSQPAHGRQVANGNGSTNVWANYRYPARQFSGPSGFTLIPSFWAGSGVYSNVSFGVPFATSYGQPDSAYPTFVPGPAFGSLPTFADSDNSSQSVPADYLASLSFGSSGSTRRQQLYGSIRQPLTPVPNVEPSAAEWHDSLEVLLNNRLAERGSAPFTRPWLKENKYLAPWGYRQSKQWSWGSTGLTALNDWLGTDWNLNATPIVYFGPNDVQVPYPVAVYATEECLALADRADQKNSFDPKWMPLGVFGLLPPRAGTFSTTVQLAVNRQGVIRGYAIETETKRINEVKGSLDRSTLRLAFTISGTNPGTDSGTAAHKFETSAANLLQGESLINVYKPADQTVGTWEVFRDTPQ